MWDNYPKISISRKEVDDFISIFEWNGITLDLGCGYKRISEKISSLGGKVFTLDRERKFRPDILADVKHLPIKNKSVDFVVTDGLLEHFNDDDLIRVLKEEERVFKRRVVNIMPKNIWWNRLLEFFQMTPKVYWKDKDEWNIVSALVFSNVLIGFRGLRRLYVFIISPFTLEERIHHLKVDVL
jgi:SAM-dependent methyltransferase